MTRWVESLRVTYPVQRREDAGYCDWLAVGSDTPRDLISTAYLARSADLLARSYRITGHPDEAAKYQRLFEDVRATFRRVYVAPDGRIEGETPCACTLALRFGLLPDALRPKVVQRLADDVAAHGNHLAAGFVGVDNLLPALSAGGRTDTAYALLMQDMFPSWLFSAQQDATTIWERWDGWTPGSGFQSPDMNAFDQYALGSCGEWVYETVAGIGEDDAPGFQRMIINPHSGGGLTIVRAARETMYGRVESAWALVDNRFTLDMTLPANTTAHIVLPTTDAASVTEGGQSLADLKDATLVAPTNGHVTLAIGSGTYHFACALDVDRTK